MIHVNRGATSLGAFSEEEVREGLRTGRFLPSDIGWREGMASWKPLPQFSEIVASRGAIPAPPPAARSALVVGQTEPLAIMSVIFGGAGLLQSVLSGIVGVICGHSALARIRREPELRGHSLAVGGLITGYVGVVLGLISWIVLIRGENFTAAIIRLSAAATLVLGFFLFAVWMAFTRKTWGWIITANGLGLALAIESALGRRDGEGPVALVLISMFVGFTVTAIVRAFRRRTRQWIMLALSPLLFIALGLCEGGILVLIHTLAHPKPGHSGLTSLTTFGQASNTDVTRNPDVDQGRSGLAS
jgi:uncharacterized membrane protein YdcZ (DUF606 family)